MAGTRSEQEAMAMKLAAERVAREAEEAHRRDIMEKILILENEITECRELISSFSSLRGQVEGSASRMSSMNIQELYPAVTSFFGVTASATEDGILGAMNSIISKAEVIYNVDSAIGTQIGRLEWHIKDLNSRINALKEGL